MIRRYSAPDMTYLCVPILAEDAPSALAEAKHARLAGADLIEFRIDHLFHGEGDDEGASAVEMIVRDSPLPCIVTCRPAWEGGDYDGDESARISLFERLGTLDVPPRYIDIELAALERSANLRQKALLAVDHPAQGRDLSTSMILSAHDFDGRPADLSKRIVRMREEPAARIHKIAYRARSLRDNLELFELLRMRDRAMIALGMGGFGLMSRVLAPKFGGFLTFASLRREAATAPGQPTLADLLSLYNFHSITASTRVFGVIGWPVEHSLSPHIHNAGFASPSAQFDGVYLPLPVPPEWENFKATLGALASDEHLDFFGASVTIPHKEHLLRFALEHENDGWRIDALAQRVGAGNTIMRTEEGGWLVTNTDVAGVMAPLQMQVGELAGARVAVIGAGGAARAAVAGLAEVGAHVCVFNRTAERAIALAQEMCSSTGAGVGGVDVEGAALDSFDPRHFDIIINCTPVGMASGPAPDESPIAGSDLDRAAPDAIIFDTVYNPLETPLLRAASERNLGAISGLEMFIHQAAAQFGLWTKRPAPIQLFEQVARERLSHASE